MELQSLDSYKRRYSANRASNLSMWFSSDTRCLQVRWLCACTILQKKVTIRCSILTKSSRIRPKLVDLLVIPELRIPEEHKILYQVWRMCEGSCTISKRCTQTLTSEWGNPVGKYKKLPIVGQLVQTTSNKSDALHLQQSMTRLLEGQKNSTKLSC